MDQETFQFDDESWTLLPDLLGHLQQPVRLQVWCDEAASRNEKEAVRLVRSLADRFEGISSVVLPRRINYHYYPVIGVFGQETEEAVDHGVRIIGLPAGVQMTSLVTAIQSVAFRAMTSEAVTRIMLSKLAKDVTLELLTSSEDEAGTVMAHRIFNMAVASPFIRSFLVMVDAFPDAAIRYSIRTVPHLVINGKTHVEGVVDEADILKHISRSLKATRDSINPR